LTQAATALIGGTGYLGSRIAAAVPQPLLVPDDVARAEPDTLRRYLTALQPATIINAAGLVRGAGDDLWAANAVLPATAAAAANDVGAHLIHVGSAAEYGFHPEVERYGEDLTPQPVGSYGQSKAAGTESALTAASVTVFRLFNLATNPTRPGTPLDDVAGRLHAAVRERTDVQLYAPHTVRDWVVPEFLVTSVVHAVANRPLGLWNVCSGVGVSFHDAVRAALRHLGVTADILAESADATRVVGDPTRWTATSGLQTAMSAETLGRLLADNRVPKE